MDGVVSRKRARPAQDARECAGDEAGKVNDDEERAGIIRRQVPNYLGDSLETAR
jgi:hypothetical protein